MGTPPEESCLVLRPLNRAGGSVDRPVAMKHDPDFSAALLDRSIAQNEQRLANAQAIINNLLDSQVQRDLDRLMELKRKMDGCAVSETIGSQGIGATY